MEPFKPTSREPSECPTLVAFQPTIGHRYCGPRVTIDCSRMELHHWINLGEWIQCCVYTRVVTTQAMPDIVLRVRR